MKLRASAQSDIFAKCELNSQNFLYRLDFTKLNQSTFLSILLSGRKAYPAQDCTGNQTSVHGRTMSYKRAYFVIKRYVG